MKCSATLTNLGWLHRVVNVRWSFQDFVWSESIPIVLLPLMCFLHKWVKSDESMSKSDCTVSKNWRGKKGFSVKMQIWWEMTPKLFLLSIIAFVAINLLLELHKDEIKRRHLFRKCDIRQTHMRILYCVKVKVLWVVNGVRFAPGICVNEALDVEKYVSNTMHLHVYNDQQ